MRRDGEETSATASATARSREIRLEFSFRDQRGGGPTFANGERFSSAALFRRPSEKRVSSPAVKALTIKVGRYNGRKKTRILYDV
eukprot:1176011-Prorocentrum_minimum.AAC.4